ncbi:unnamed protein product [Owenia fusiformis]|uniref:Uncharacterized protein n=1 Tax=Owenia fusiformis TaxID=6347 RepID=A0A8J1XTI0_OWEFU|nr:unnamed protein product [Owenia fusiformis]
MACICAPYTCSPSLTPTTARFARDLAYYIESNDCLSIEGLFSQIDDKGKLRDIISAEIPIDYYGRGTCLHLASWLGYTDILQFLFKTKVRANLPQSDGRIPLHAAAEAGHTDTVKFLINRFNIERHIKVSIQDRRGQTALHKACHGGHADTVKLLIWCGARVNIKDIHGQTPLHKAIHGDKLSLIEFLVVNGAKVNKQDRIGRTALHLATAEGKDNIAEFLVAMGADLDITNKSRNTPLDLCDRELRHKLKRIMQRASFLIDQASSKPHKNKKKAILEGMKETPLISKLRNLVTSTPTKDLRYQLMSGSSRNLSKSTPHLPSSNTIYSSDSTLCDEKPKEVYKPRFRKKKDYSPPTQKLYIPKRQTDTESIISESVSTAYESGYYADPELESTDQEGGFDASPYLEGPKPWSPMHRFNTILSPRYDDSDSDDGGFKRSSSTKSSPTKTKRPEFNKNGYKQIENTNHHLYGTLL